CKIKALRAKTNTYIKTPVRGEEPVFVVTGRKEDVANAKREILSAADHFSQIRACRKNNINGSMAPGPPANVPGQKTINVTVPYRVVGLVVGPKGATIKRIQQTTQTYIVTPSRDKEPIFEVTGLPESVEAAKREIESHIAMRTGSLLDEDAGLPPYDPLSNAAELYNMYSTPKSATHGSLNALLSSNGYNQHNSMLATVNAQYSALLNGHSHGSLNGHSGLTSVLANNALGNLGSNYNSLSNINPLSSLSNMLASNSANNLVDLPCFNSLTNSSNANNLLNSGSSSAFSSNSASVGGHSAFGSASNVFNDFSPFNLLGEQANNILNSKGSGLDHASSSTSLLSSLNCSSMATGNSALQSMYGLDEGLGSLESSMGSSPSLDQNQAAQSIWSDAKYQTPLSSYSFNGRSFGGSSGSASRSLSPSRGLNHGSVQRSNSDPTPKIDVLSSALSQLTVNGGLRRSNSSSPEALPDFDASPYTAMSGLSNSSPVGGSSLLAELSAVSAIGTAVSSSSSILSSLPGASAMPISLMASAAGAVPIGTPAAASSAEAASSGSSTGSRRSSVDGPTGGKTCPSCKGESFEVAFVPCGHRRFCLPCAQKIQDSTGTCPSCHAESKEVIRIRDDHE
ncbi:hypothetical protein HAZT_HAZT008331, partial [Hyalella azteca]